MADLPEFLANLGYPGAMIDGLIPRLILKGLIEWDRYDVMQPLIYQILPPRGIPDGRPAFEQNIMIDPLGEAKVALPQSWPTFVEGHMKRAQWGTLLVKEGLQYNDMDAVHGLPGLVGIKSRMVVNYIQRAIDRWGWRNLLGDADAMDKFNPSGEWKTYRKTETGVTGSPSTNEFRMWSESSSTPLNDIDTWLVKGIRRGAPEGVTPRLYVGPNTFRYMKTNTQITEIAKYWDRQMISNPDGVLHMSIRGIPIIEIRGRIKVTDASSIPPELGSEGTFQKADETNDLMKFYMDSPDDENYEDGLLVWGTPGSTDFAKLAPDHNFGGGAALQRMHRDTLRGITTISQEKMFCSRIENPFAILHLKHIAPSLHA